MPNTTLTITGTQSEMTPEELKQKLSQLYKQPEEKFEHVCRALLVDKTPYVLIKEIDSVEVLAHHKRLKQLGFTCDEPSASNADEFGLSLAPVDAVNGDESEVECPACSQPSGGGEVCQNCGVVIQKFVEHKKFDDQLQSQLRASTYSQERVEELRAEKTTRDQQVKEAAKRNKIASKGDKNESDEQPNTSDNASHSSGGEEQVVVHADVKTSKKLYAAVASVLLVVVGAGVAAYTFIDTDSSKDELVATTENPNQSGLSNNSAASQELIPVVEVEPEFIPETAFDFQILHQRELASISGKLKQLHGEGMTFSIAHMISAKEDPRERIFATQESIRLENFADDTLKRLEESHALLGDLDKDLDRVQMLLNQASIYQHFERYSESEGVLEQATMIAKDIDNGEDKVMADVAFAEFHTLAGNTDDAMINYKRAKDQCLYLRTGKLVDAGLDYVAMSEDKFKRAEAEAEALAGASATNLSKLQDLSAGSPSLGAAQESDKVGDPLIDDLIEMTKKNQQTLKAASKLLGQ